MAHLNVDGMWVHGREELVKGDHCLARVKDEMQTANVREESSIDLRGHLWWGRRYIYTYIRIYMY